MAQQSKTIVIEETYSKAVKITWDDKDMSEEEAEEKIIKMYSEDNEPVLQMSDDDFGNYEIRDEEEADVGVDVSIDLSSPNISPNIARKRFAFVSVSNVNEARIAIEVDEDNTEEEVILAAKNMYGIGEISFGDQETQNFRRLGFNDDMSTPELVFVKTGDSDEYMRLPRLSQNVVSSDVEIYKEAVFATEKTHDVYEITDILKAYVHVPKGDPFAEESLRDAYSLGKIVLEHDSHFVSSEIKKIDDVQGVLACSFYAYPDNQEKKVYRVLSLK